MADRQRSRPRPRLIRGTIDRIEGELAVIVLDTGGEVLWPKDLLAEGARPGVVVIVAMVTDEMRTAEREREVRDLLDEIFGSA